jgi:glyoxylase-like metal-dependent hydrolase (beta-lactamase superfamily II)
MESTSPAQSTATDRAIVPELEAVRDDVWALGLAMDGDHIPFSLLYLLRDSDGGLHVVDPGTDSDANLASVLAAVAALGGVPSDVRSITATHLHPDHLGLADRLRDATGAPVQTSRAEASALGRLAESRLTADDVAAQAARWGVPTDRVPELIEAARRLPDYPAPRIDRPLDDGEVLPIPGFELTAILTPGHTTGHVCLRDDSRGILFSGDHILPTMFAGLGLGGPSATNALADYVASCERVAGLGPAGSGDEVLPGHGYRFTGLEGRARASAAHHLTRTGQVEAVLAHDPDASIWAIASRLTWTAGFDNLAGFFLWSALSQTAMHRDYVRG